VNAALDELEQKASHLRVPLSYSDLLYTLRVHIALVREHIAKTETPAGEGRDRRPTSE
jgi:hypothetical protein